MFFPIMPSLVCVHDNKMTHGPVCGCNDVFGVQDYHIAGTRWLRRDRKSAVCFFFFCEIAFDNHFYSLIGLLRNITTTRLGEDENYFFYFPVFRFILLLQDCKCLELFIVSSGPRLSGVASALVNPVSFPNCSQINRLQERSTVLLILHVGS